MDKFKSRKFIVWIVWLLIIIASMIVKDIPKDTVYNFFGFISMVYIGGNLADKFISSKGKVNE